MLRLSQQKYLTKTTQVEQPETSVAQNFTISNKLKGVLGMCYDASSKTIQVVENPWRKTLAEFNGAFVTKKFNK